MEPSQFVDEDSFDLAVKQVESNTARHLYPLWMTNWRNNLSDASAGESLDRIYRRPKVERALIIGRGPSIYKHRHLELLAERGFPGKVVASDGALPLLSEHGAKADYSVTVDGNQVIQKWYKPQYRNACNEGFRVVLPVTAHRATYNACMKSGMKVSWYIPELDTENFKNLTEVLQLQTISEDNPTGLSRMNGAGCLKKGTLVYTPNGPVPIENLKIGSVVYSLSQPRIIALAGTRGPIRQVTEQVQLSKVTNVIDQGEKEVFKLRTRTRCVEATSDHKFLRIKSGVMKWVELKDLNEGDSVVIAKSLPEQTSVHDNVNPDLLRFLGCYLGDGWIRFKGENGGEMGLALPSYTDLVMREKYRRIIISLFGKIPSENRAALYVYSGALAKLIKELGFEGKAKTKKIPSWLFTLPKHLILCFLEGYADADGHRRISKSGFGYNIHSVEFEAANRLLINQIRVLCIKVGWRTSNVYYRKRNIKIFNKRRMNYYEGKTETAYFRAMPFSRLHYTGGYLSLCKPFRRTKILGIEKIRLIESNGKAPTFDITVEGTHNFIAEGIVTHNCAGNACIIFAATILNVKEIVLLGMDSGYSQDTPLSELHYHDNILAGCGYDKEKAAKLYKIYYSEAWQQYCVVDPVFAIYRQTALSLFQHLQAGGVKIKNCTGGGCLTADGVETPTFREYLDSTV